MKKKSITKGGIIAIVIALLLLTAGIVFAICFINNQKETEADIQLVKNLNTAVDLELSNNPKIEKYPTAYDAVVACARHGYLVNTIVATSEFDIAWYATTGKFVLVNTSTGDVLFPHDKVVETSSSLNDEVNYFIFRPEMPTVSYETNYSVFAGNGWATPAVSLNGIGFDAGYHYTIKTVTYQNNTGASHDVIIRTNGGELIVNDQSEGSVNHYAKLVSLDIVNCYLDSYHEYGHIDFANVKAGHVVFEENSSVEALHFETSGTETVNGNTYDTFDKIILSYADGIEQPVYSRDAISINPAGTKVCTLNLYEETNNIYLTLNGIYEQVVIEGSTPAGEAQTEKEWVSTSDATMKTKIASDQISNNFGTRTSALSPNAGDDQPVLNETTREIINTEVPVTDPGLPKETAKDEALAYINVKAEVTEEDPTNIECDLWFVNNYASRVQLDSVYLFDAFSSADQLYINEYVDAILAYEKELTGRDLTIKDFHLEWFFDETATQAALAKLSDYSKERVNELLTAREQFLSYQVDFEVSFSQDIKKGSIALGGYYGSFAENFNDGDWLGFGMAEVLAKNNFGDVKAGQTVRLLQSMYEQTGNADMHMSYAAICGYVREFACGVANLDDENIGTTITVKLCIYKTDENGVELTGDNAERIECGTYTYTFGKVSNKNLEYIQNNKQL